MLLRIRHWAILICLLCASPAAAEPTVTYEELERAVLQSSPAAAAVSSRLAGERAKGVAATASDNPELGAEVRPYLSGHEERDVEYEIGISKPVRLWGVSERRVYQRLVEEHATLDERLSLFELKQKTKLLYGKAWALQEREGQIGAHLESLRSLGKKLSELSERGAAAKSTIHLVKAEAERLRGTLIGLGADKKRTLAELVRMSSVPLGVTRLAPLPAAKLSGEEQSAVFPAAERARLAARIAASQSEIARLDAYPKLAPRVAFEHTADGDDRLNVGLQIELPFLSRNESARLESRAKEAEENALEKYFTGDAFRDEERLLRESVRATAEERTVYETKVLPELAAALNASGAEFDSGQASPAQVWQTILALSEAEERSLELATKALAERVELSILLGTDI